MIGGRVVQNSKKKAGDAENSNTGISPKEVSVSSVGRLLPPPDTRLTPGKVVVAPSSSSNALADPFQTSTTVSDPFAKSRYNTSMF